MSTTTEAAASTGNREAVNCDSKAAEGMPRPADGETGVTVSYFLEVGAFFFLVVLAVQYSHSFSDRDRFLV